MEGMGNLLLRKILWSGIFAACVVAAGIKTGYLDKFADYFNLVKH